MIVTAVVLLAISVIKVYDLVVAMTNGGPGIGHGGAGQVHHGQLFTRQNIGLAAAASTVMLVTVIALLAPWLYVQYFRRERPRRPA